MNKLSFATLLLILMALPEAHADLNREAPPSAALLATWTALDAPTGHEHHVTRTLEALLSGWTADRMGNLSKTIGESSGEGRGVDVVACLLDAPSFTVSEIRSDGYLRLHLIGRPRINSLWSQAHEGQQLRVLTRDGPVLGVAALANGHFMNLHRNESALTRPEDLWLDVGATSGSEVAEMGIQLLDPVLRHLPAWHFEDWIAGPAAGARTGCALVVAAAEAGLHGPRRTRYLLSTQSAFRGVGLSAAIADLDQLERVLVFGPGRESTGQNETPPAVVAEVFAAFDTAKLRQINPPVRGAGALMELMHVRQARELADALASFLDTDVSALSWLEAPESAPARNRDTAWIQGLGGDPELQDFAGSLRTLASLYAVGGHETPVREAVLADLPDWARARAETDALGNLWVDAGPREGDATVFLAHMDEVGWRVTAIRRDGTVDLERQGGALSLAREGQPALLHISPVTGVDAAAAPSILRGRFALREAPTTRWPETLQAWFGMDREALEARGVAVGMPVTGYKEAHRLGHSRFTARSMDDRVGTAALLAAVQRIDPGSLKQRVVFAWTVREEGGLHGARALAQRFAGESRRVYSIDTFVTSDTPLESPHFAYAPLGAGPVLRSMENSGLARPAELARNRAVAAAAGITVQVGITQGGTDGTAFTFYGAPNAGLSWPGRYSHGPAELGDLRDMSKLISLIEAFVLADP